MLFQNTYSGAGNETEAGIIQKMNTFYQESMEANNLYQYEAEIDTQFYLGKQSSYPNIPLGNKSKAFYFNRIKRIINMISGHQRAFRKSAIATPVYNADQVTADQFSQILIWLNNVEGIDTTLSDAFESSCITGLSLLQLWIDYRLDPVSGDIKIDHCPFNTFVIDPNFKKANLSDCNGIWKRSFVTKYEAATLVPDKKDTILEMYGSQMWDGKFELAPEARNFLSKDLLTYDEFYFKTYRNRKLLVDTQTGETFDWKYDAKDERLALFLAKYPSVTVVESNVPTVNLAVVIQGRVMYVGPQPSGLTSMPFVPVFGYFCPQATDYSQKVQGIVRNLRDPQELFNRRKNIELSILESQITSGWIYKEDSLVNPKDVYEQIGQGRGIGLKRGAQLTDIQQIMPPQIPPSMLQISEALGREIMEISGVSEELLGTATDSKAGILAKLRQGSGLIMLQGLFDKLDLTQTLITRLILEAIQCNYMPGKVKNILDNAEPAPQFYSKAFGRYDVMIEEGHNTTTQRQMALAQMVELRQLGVPIPDESLIEASAIQNKTSVIQAMQQQQQAQQQAQEAQMQVQMQELQARTELSKARAFADTGLGLERTSRVEENEASAEERKAEAVADRNQATLNLVKAMKEIDDIDINQLQKLISLMGMVKMQEADVNAAVQEKESIPQQARLVKQRKQHMSLKSNVEGII
jgi:hypothetical protein